MVPRCWRHAHPLLFATSLFASRFLIEIINDTPLNIGGASASEPKYAAKPEPAHEPQAPRVVGAKFKVPVASGSGPPRQVPRPGGARQPLGRYGKPPQQQQQQPPPPDKTVFDFDRHPTSEWSYTPNAVERTSEHRFPRIYQLTLSLSI